jgi:hypothetical protein
MNNLDFDNMTIDQLTVALDLDEEERELLASIENDEWVSIPNEKEEIFRLRQMAIADRSRQKIEVNLSLQLDSGKFSMRVSGEKKIGHPIPKSAVMSETG